MSAKYKVDRPAWIALLLFAAVIAAYLPAVLLGFTNYDDPYYVSDNPRVLAGLTWDGFGWAFTNTQTGNWHPITFLSHMLDCQLFGGRPAGHHATSALLHALNTVLVFILLRSLTLVTWRSAVVAALFGLHPLRVESVAWIAERKDVLSTCFGLLSLWFYARYARGAAVQAVDKSATMLASRSQRFDYWSCFLCLALGLMSKPMLVTWPCVMWLLDYWPLGRLRFERESRAKELWPLVKEKLPFFALTAASCLVTFLVQRAAKAVAPLDDISIWSRSLNAIMGYFMYLGKLFWPVKLAVIYPYVTNWNVPEVLVALLSLAAMSGLAVWQRRQQPYLLVSWCWYLGTLVPVIGLVQVGNQFIADRYTYVPAIGFFLVLVWTVAEWAAGSSRRRIWVAAATVPALTICAVGTQTQLMYWQNSETLFRRALAVTRDNYIALNSLGFFAADNRQAREAEHYFRAALAINPRCEWTLNKLGSLWLDQGRLEEAAASCQAALELNPRRAEAHGTLGLICVKQGKTNEALGHYRAALELQPDNSTTHYNLANLLAQQSQLAPAREHYLAAVHLDPRSADAHNNLAFVLAREGQLDAAVAEFRAALALKPNLWQARYGLGESLVRQGKPADAAEEFQRALELNPGFMAARLQLGLALAAQEKLAGAAQVFAEAARLAPTQPAPEFHLAETLARIGKLPEAIAAAERAEALARNSGQDAIARKSQKLIADLRARLTSPP